MIKGFVFFKEGRLPFVINDYTMELFTDDDLLSDFAKTYNFEKDYVLHGECFRDGFRGENASFLVEYSMGSTCFLRCYILNIVEEGYDTIGLQSLFLDDIFRYKYKCLEFVRTGINLGVEPVDAYRISFSMNGTQYESTFRLGHDNRLGILEDFDRKGEFLLSLQTNTLQECYDISMVWYRLAMFMTSNSEVPFKRISLYKNARIAGWFYCPLVSRKAVSTYDSFFYEFDVMKYVPRILNNLALDSGNRITQSIPLGHLGNYDSKFLPQRFMEQVMAFEYLFNKLEPQKAQNRRYSLKKELEDMLNEFPKLLDGFKASPSEISEQIKEIRRTIAHGYAYYYDFKNDIDNQRLIILLDKLIRNMSLFCIGFSKDEIDEYSIRAL